jgi:uncharacterized protein YbjT (DUF2867 family)
MILVLGGTGKTGRRVTQRLQDTGRRVRVATRSTGFDLDDPTTWALDGVTAAYLIEPSAQPTRLPRLVDAAGKAGVRRLVLMTAPGVENNMDHPLWPAEQAVRTSGPEWTIVRPTWFAQNFSEAFFLPGIRAGELVLPTGDGKTTFVDAEDIADVVTAALTDDGHNGQAYGLTGAQAHSFGEAVELISAATGRTIRHVDIDPDDYTAAQIADGVPAETARQVTNLYVSIRKGQATETLDGVRRALGRQPRAFEDYVTTTAASGVWNP